MWSLPKFERLHIGGLDMKFYKQPYYMFPVTHKVMQKNAWPSSIKNNRTHTSQAANQLSDCRRTNTCTILNERVCEVIPHLWLSWPRTCMFWRKYHKCSVGLTWGEGQASPYILFLLRSVYSLTKQAQHGRGFHVLNHKVLGAVSLTFLSLLREGFTPIFSATYGRKSVSL